MRLVTYSREGTRRLGAWVEGSVVDLPDAVGHPVFPSSMEALVGRNGGTTMDVVLDALGRPRIVEEHRVPRARLVAPLLLKELPSPAPVLGPGARVPWPPSLDPPTYRFQLACIVGRRGRDLSAEQAGRAIFGCTLMATWSLPGGPADAVSALALGPWVVTPDELVEPDLTLEATVDGRPARRETIASVASAARRMVARRSRAGVSPGDVFALGGFDVPANPGDDPRLEPGATIELSAPGFGVLRNRLGRR